MCAHIYTCMYFFNLDSCPMIYCFVKNKMAEFKKIYSKIFLNHKTFKNIYNYNKKDTY